LNACSVSLSDKNAQIENLAIQLSKAKEEIENLNKLLVEASRDAGFKDSFVFALQSMLAIMVLILIGFVLFLIFKGKIRIPGLIG
jgi:gamma-glutamyl phosphate reductase